MKITLQTKITTPNSSVWLTRCIMPLWFLSQISPSTIKTSPNSFPVISTLITLMNTKCLFGFTFGRAKSDSKALKLNLRYVWRFLIIIDTNMQLAFEDLASKHDIYNYNFTWMYSNINHFTLNSFFDGLVWFFQKQKKNQFCWNYSTYWNFYVNHNWF